MCKHGFIYAINIMFEKLGDNLIDAFEDKDDDGDTALHIACQNGHIELVKFIIEKLGEKAITALQVKNLQNNTLLHEACQSKNVELAKFIIEKLGDKAINVLQEKNNDNDTPIYISCYVGHIDLVKIMLDKLEDEAISALQEKNNDNDTALHLACQSKNVELAKFIIEKLGCLASNVIQIKGAYNETPLYVALQNNHAELVNMMITTLIDNNYDINNILKHHGYDMYNLLMLACLEGNNSVIQHLIDCGTIMDINDIDVWSNVFQQNILTNDQKYFDSIILCNKIDANSVKIFEIITDNLDNNVTIQNALKHFNSYLTIVRKKSAYKVYIEPDDEDITNSDDKKLGLKRLKEEISDDSNQPQLKIQSIEGVNSLIDQPASEEISDDEKLLGGQEGELFC